MFLRLWAKLELSFRFCKKIVSVGGGRREDRGRRKDGCAVEGGVAVLSV